MQHGGLPGVSAMDDFPDGAFVGLQNRAKKTYLAADEDGHNVSLRAQPQGGPGAVSPNAVWRLQRVNVGGVAFVLLQGVAYCRYLAIAPGFGRAPSGYRGRRAVQRDHDGADDLADLMWTPFRMLEDLRYVSLRQDYNRTLRANGRFRFWHTAVTVDNDDDGSWSTMMQWKVRTFRLAPGLPPLPRPTTILGPRRGLFRRRKPEADERRVIAHVRANEEGDFDQNYGNWDVFPFYGRSVFNLRVQVGMRQPGGEVGSGITLVVKPGVEGRLTPLVTDLPRSVDPMGIVVFNTGSQGAQNLVYPDI